ncbi:hypothetical protein F3Y22_tig00110159pilonHSYRG00210 [Hibiscus syriacus]|uniref:Pentatricopeptide repeat-containing protein n=1 Tax=Hibiscus syriacus TaxID=106335 RepID=A0A6A3BKF5_HIBSY|nr:hypothetical protein F3Y22_tig00110159pilonHSYRG00210 [Hibiscus syriacus]
MSRCKEIVSNPGSLDYFGSLPKPLLGRQGFFMLSSKLGNIDYIVSIFRCIEDPGTFRVNSVIKAHCFSSLPPSSCGYLFSAADSRCYKTARKCHGQAIKFGVLDNLPVQNCLIHMYGCCGILEFSKKVFLEMSQKDIASWNSFINACVKVWNMGLAHNLFDGMPEKNVISWNIMIKGYLKAGNSGCALKLFRQMVELGFMGNEKIVAIVLSACSKSARLKEGRSVRGFLIKDDMKSNIIIDTALVNLYCNCQKVGLARRMFDKITNRSRVCWNAMILGHCIHGNPEDDLKLLADMVDGCTVRGEAVPNVAEDVSSDSVFFANLLISSRFSGGASVGERIATSLIDKEPKNFSYYQLLLNVSAVAGRDGNRQGSSLLKPSMAWPIPTPSGEQWREGEEQRDAELAESWFAIG